MSYQLRTDAVVKAIATILVKQVHGPWRASGLGPHGQIIPFPDLSPKLQAYLRYLPHDLAGIVPIDEHRNAANPEADTVITYDVSVGASSSGMCV